MKNCFLVLLAIIFFTSCKKNNLEIRIVNSSLTPRDSVRIELVNNTNESYLFYFKRTRFDYFSNSKNTLIAELDNNIEPVKVEITSDPLYILNEDGTYNNDDIKEMNKYQKLSSQNLIKLIPKKSTVFFNMKLIDTLNERGAKEYPILEKDKSYKLTLKMDIDSGLIEKKELVYLKNKYKKGIKTFQGKLVSNTININ